MTAHTPGPWRVSSSFYVASDTGKILARCDGLGLRELDVPPEEMFANIERIVACVNEMDGLDPRYARWAATHHETVLQTAERQLEEIDALLAQRDELVAALRGVMPLVRVNDHRDQGCVMVAEAVLARVPA